MVRLLRAQAVILFLCLCAVVSEVGGHGSHSLPVFPGSCLCAVVSAVVVAMDLMVKAKGVMNKGQKRVVLLTSATSPVDLEDLEGTQSQVGTALPSARRRLPASSCQLSAIWQCATIAQACLVIVGYTMPHGGTFDPGPLQH